ncbi:carboxy-muconate cyclase [Ilyonectria robusta]
MITDTDTPPQGSNANFIVASTAEPFTVFGAPYSSGCSSLAISVDSGTLDTSFASLEYDSAAGVHGLALSPANDFIYSADDMGDATWVHSYDSSSGVVKEVQRMSAPTGANPRHLVVHPNGLFVFVLYEELSEIAVYSRDVASGELTNTNTTHLLIPSSESSLNELLYISRLIQYLAPTNTSSYWADEVLLSVPSTNSSTNAPKYLICSTRSRETSAPGYVTAFSLDSVTGNIVEQLFIVPTTSSGGSANAVSPSTFSEDYFAITDSASNFVEFLEKTALSSLYNFPGKRFVFTRGQVQDMFQAYLASHRSPEELDNVGKQGAMGQKLIWAQLLDGAA